MTSRFSCGKSAKFYCMLMPPLIRNGTGSKYLCKFNKFLTSVVKLLREIQSQLRATVGRPRSEIEMRKRVVCRPARNKSSFVKTMRPKVSTMFAQIEIQWPFSHDDEAHWLERIDT